MKKLILLIVMLICNLSTYTYASVRDSISTPSIIEATSWGKEIGVAIDSTLGAIEEHALRIADSNLGHVAIFIVVWKFIFKDIIGLLVGAALLCLMVWLIKKILNGINEDSFSKLEEDAQGVVIIASWLAVVVLFIAALGCIF